jgi:hypothetical protein
MHDLKGGLEVTVVDILRPYARKVRTLLAGSTRMKSYPSYQDAFRHCGRGYEDRELAEVMLAKTRMLLEGDLLPILYAPFVDALMQSISAAANSGSTPVRVLDFGGSFGLYYFVGRQLASPPRFGGPLWSRRPWPALGGHWLRKA